MFLGEYVHVLDSKGRLTIPARFREDLEPGVFLTRGYEPCIVTYPPSEWERLATKIAQVPMASRTARSYGRLLFGGAHETNVDRAGRVLIPPFLREYAGIEEEAVIVGINTYLEIWAPQRWQEIQATDSMQMDTILADMTRLGV